MFTGIVTTAKKYVGGIPTSGGLLIDATKMEGMLNSFQTVIAVGKMVTDVKPGDIVHLNLKRYLMAKHLPGKIEDNVQADNMQARYEIPMVTLDDQECLLIQNTDIDYVVEDPQVDEGGLLQ